MAQKNDTAILVAALVITAAILGGGYWFLTRNRSNPIVIQSPSPNPPPTQPQTQNPNNSTPLPSPPSVQPVPNSSNFSLPSQVAAGTTVNINGSTSMVLINEALKNGFTSRFSGTVVNTNAQGTDKGILALLTGKIDIAATSRPLSPEEKSQGLAAVPISPDVIAIVTGKDNPFRKGLKQNQVVGIFQGNITNWSEVGGTSGTIRVINRPAISGTHQAFQERVLNGGTFGTGSNFTMMQRDATTPILRALGTDGISYATYAQVADQQTVRVIPIDGTTPEASNYPFQRTLYYVYKQPPSPAVQSFLGYATSAEGKQVISQAQQ
ncbi:MAG: phosphate ABC transporter substrate-binding protein [Microcystaceae cyanobacterium]